MESNKAKLQRQILALKNNINSCTQSGKAIRSGIGFVLDQNNTLIQQRKELSKTKLVKAIDKCLAANFKSIEVGISKIAKINDDVNRRCRRILR